MTIDVNTFREIDLLIKPFPRTFYPSKIPLQHHQLKNFISPSNPDIVYFASRYEIYSLHTGTQTRRLIASLTFEPQCLGAGYGWLCVGGVEKGRCAFIEIEEAGSSHGSSRAPAYAEVDTLLPLDLDPESRMLAHDFLNQRRTSPLSARRRSKVHYQEFGGLIVNSITVHQLRSGKDGLKDEVVAVLTNNDATVRIYSLTQSRLLQTLDFPTYMNHATISPNGELLVAVGDQPRAFFCKRKRLASLAVDGQSVYARYEWHEIAGPKLSIAVPWDTCFSTAFSPSGHLCAVASQVGTITVFDTRLIRDNMETDDAVIDVLRSSRPSFSTEDSSGAVRSMSFSPEPWDLFAWAEDRGRVCVTDLRSAFRSRQTLDLDVNAVDIVIARLSDYDESASVVEQRELEIEARFVQRHREALDAQDHLAAVNHAADYMEVAAERRRLRRELRDAGQRFSIHDPTAHIITEDEREILESLRAEGQRDNEREQERRGASQHPFSVHYLQSSDTSPTRRPEVAEPSTAALSSTPQPRNTSIHQYMRERYLDRTRPTDRSYQPRRRSSVVISNSTTSNPSFLFHPSSLAPIGTNTSTLSASPSRLASTIPTGPSTSTAPATSLPRPTPSTGPWQTISAAMTSTSALETAARLRRERESAATTTTPNTATEPTNFERRMAHQAQAARADRARAERLRSMHQRAGEGVYEDYELEMLRRVANTGVRQGREDAGVGTMGIGWSGDGRFLYVGTEEGIMEFAVNVQERKTFPSAAFR